MKNKLFTICILVICLVFCSIAGCNFKAPDDELHVEWCSGNSFVYNDILYCELPFEYKVDILREEYIGHLYTTYGVGKPIKLYGFIPFLCVYSYAYGCYSEERGRLEVIKTSSVYGKWYDSSITLGPIESQEVNKYCVYDARYDNGIEFETDTIFTFDEIVDRTQEIDCSELNEFGFIRMKINGFDSIYYLLRISCVDGVYYTTPPDNPMSSVKLALNPEWQSILAQAFSQLPD